MMQIIKNVSLDFPHNPVKLLPMSNVGVLLKHNKEVKQIDK